MTEPKIALTGPQRSRKLLDSHAAAIKELQADVKKLKAENLDNEQIIIVQDGNLRYAEIPMRLGAFINP